MEHRWVPRAISGNIPSAIAHDTAATRVLLFSHHAILALQRKGKEKEHSALGLKVNLELKVKSANS